MHVGVDGLLTDESAHVIYQLGILHQRQRLVVRGDEPPLRGGQYQVEKTNHVRSDRVPGNPVQRDIGEVEMNLSRLDLHWTGVDLALEPLRSQHGGLLAVGSSDFT